MTAHPTKYIAFILLACLTTGCFTGIESTPKVTARDVKRQKATPTPEMSYTSGVKGEPISMWTQGKEFTITDSRISLALSPYAISRKLNKNDIIHFAGIKEIPSMTDIDDTLLQFTTASGDTVNYRINSPMAENLNSRSIEIPFTIEMSLVHQTDSLMKGNTYYITTPIWFDSDGMNINGLKFVPVKIDSVTPGNTNYPLSVNFTDSRGEQSRVFMSLGNSRRATRNFDTLFLLEDPRAIYKDIPEDIWQCITRSEVKIDMTRDQCRLSLGNPREVYHGHYLERWTYDSGLTLIFDEGYLRHIGRTDTH